MKARPSARRGAGAPPTPFVGLRCGTRHRNRLASYHAQVLDIKVAPDGTVTCSTKNRVHALKILAQHLDLIDPEPAAPATPSGPVTVNMTEIYLDGLSLEELQVLKASP